MKLPQQVRTDALCMKEVHDFLQRQRNISAKNIKRLKQLSGAANSKLAELAAVVLQIALVAPYRRRRFTQIKKGHPQLWERMLALDLVPYEDSEKGDFNASHDDDSVDEGDDIPFGEGDYPQLHVDAEEPDWGYSGDYWRLSAEDREIPF